MSRFGSGLAVAVACVCVVALTGCGGGGGGDGPAGVGARAISDELHNDGTEGFFFLPPIADDPGAAADGVFD
ncbi:MAG: hypothetical protein ACE5R4_15445, partial [Armatimonadota bacterium]